MRYTNKIEIEIELKLGSSWVVVVRTVQREPVQQMDPRCGPLLCPESSA